MRRFSRSTSISSIEEPTVNLTPLIDVVFVILITFILIAPLVELERIELAIAPPATDGTTNVQENGPIAIHVQSDNSIWLNKQRIKSTELVTVFKRARLAHPNVRPQLFHDKKAQFGTYQEVKNAAEMAGFQEMDILLQPG